MNDQHKHEESVCDFPSFVPPLLVKELRQGLRTKGFVLFVAFFPIVLALLFLFYFLQEERGVYQNVLNQGFWACAYGVFLLFNPLRSLNSVFQEKRTRAGELIVLSRLSPERIVFEKWVSYVLQTLMVGMVLLPFFLLRYFLGGVELMPEAIALFYMFAGSCFLTVLGLWISGMPVAYRLLYVFSIIGFFIKSFPNDSFFDYYSSGIQFVICGTWTVMAWFGCRALLFLSARWFVFPSGSGHMIYDFRKTLIYISSAAAVGCLLVWWLKDDLLDRGADASFFKVGIIFLVGSFMTEMLLPVKVRAIDLRELEQRGRFSRWLMPLWLSGVQSTGLFYLLVLTYWTSPIGFALGTDWDSMVEVYMWILLIWANVVFMTVVFRPLWRRMGIYSLGVCFFICLALLLFYYFFISSRIDLENGIWALMPVMNILSIGTTANSPSGHWCYIIVIGLLFLGCSASYWKKYAKWKRQDSLFRR